MAAANTVRAVTTAICTIWTMNGANQAGKFIKSRQIPISQFQKLEVDYRLIIKNIIPKIANPSQIAII